MSRRGSLRPLALGYGRRFGCWRSRFQIPDDPVAFAGGEFLDLDDLSCSFIIVGKYLDSRADPFTIAMLSDDGHRSKMREKRQKKKKQKRKR